MRNLLFGSLFVSALAFAQGGRENPNWRVQGFGSSIPSSCAGRSVWIYNDGTYRYCLSGIYSNPFAGGANTALSNLSSVSINTALLFQSGIDLGSTAAPARNLYIYGAGTFGSTYLKFTGTPTGTRVWTFQDATDTVVGLNTSDTLANKTLTTPTIGSFANANHDHSNSAGGGNLSNTAVGSGNKEGNGTKFAMFSGSDPATNDCAKFDADHNVVGAGGPCTTGGLGTNPTLGAGNVPSAITQSYTNDGSTGTANGKIAKLSADNTVVKVGTSDTEAVGIVVSGGASSGSAEVAISGSVACTFSNTSTAGHYVQISGTTAGDCLDAGATLPTSGGTILGRVIDGGSAGSHNVALAITPPGGSGGTGPSITQGAFGSIPGTCTTNDLYLFTDSVLNQARCSATNAWSYFYRGQLATPASATSFTTENSGTQASAGGATYFTAPSSGSNLLRLFSVSVPTAPYTRTAIIRPGLTSTSSSTECGLFLYDGTKVETVNVQGGSGWSNSDWTNTTTFSGPIASGNLSWGSDIWIELSDDNTGSGTARKAKISVDGVNYITVSSQSPTAFLTPTKIGFYVNNSNSKETSCTLVSWQ